MEPFLEDILMIICDSVIENIQLSGSTRLYDYWSAKSQMSKNQILQVKRLFKIRINTIDGPKEDMYYAKVIRIKLNMVSGEFR